MQILSPHHEKHKIRENYNNRKNDSPRGDPWRSKKIFCRNFSNKLYIRSSCGVLITKNKKLEKILTIEKLTPQGGDPWDFGGRKNFLSKFCKQTMYSEFIWGPHHKKHKIRKNLNYRKNDPWTPKMLISQVLSFEPNWPCW